MVLKEKVQVDVYFAGLRSCSLTVPIAELTWVALLEFCVVSQVSCSVPGLQSTILWTLPASKVQIFRPLFTQNCTSMKNVLALLRGAILLRCLPNVW